MSKWNDVTLIGTKSGRLTVISQAEKVNNRPERFWNCLCECGKQTVLNTSRIKSQHTKSCGCLHNEQIHRDLTGKKFGDLTVTKSVGKRKDRVLWECVCICGVVIERNTSLLTRGQVKSCGCRRKIPTRMLPNGEAARNNVIRMYRENALKIGRSFELSLEQCELLFKSNCHYCGDAPSRTRKGKGIAKGYTYNGIDRKDNTKGYTVDNSVSCCTFCNFKKGSTNHDDFLAWVKKIYQNIS